jgi:hypothetical protein
MNQFGPAHETDTSAHDVDAARLPFRSPSPLSTTRKVPNQILANGATPLPCGRPLRRNRANSARPSAPRAQTPRRCRFPPRALPLPPPPAKADLLRLIVDQRRGLETQSDPSRLSDIVSCIDALAVSSAGIGTDTFSDARLSGTWRLLWTTEREQLFIVQNAPAFRTAAGDVLQVIDVPGGTLNNVITFPPSGAFVVDGDIEI